MRIAIFGAGAIGGFIAAALSRSGVDVCAVSRGAHLEVIRRAGLRVRTSDLGPFTAQFPVSNDLRDFSDVEYVLLTFKSHQWDGVVEQVGPAVAAGASFVTLQNGLPFWYSRDRALESVDPGGRIRDAIPYEQIIGGVVHASGHVARPGVIEQSGGTLYPLGEPDGEGRPRTRALSEAFEAAGLRAPIEPDIRAVIWRKLVNNTALNPVSALTRATVRQMLQDAGCRAMLHSIIDESLAVARASGIDAGVDADERLRWAEHIADVKTSMLQDLEAKKPLELDPIAGAVVELARRYDVPVPHVETAYALTKLLEKIVAAN